MVLSLDSSESLKRLFERFSLSPEHGEVLERSYGIKSVLELLPRRKQMMNFGHAQKSFDSTRRFLLYTIDFLFLEGQKEKKIQARFAALLNPKDPAFLEFAVSRYDAAEKSKNLEQKKATTPQKKQDSSTTTTTVTIKDAGPTKIAPRTMDDFEKNLWVNKLDALKQKLGIDKDGSSWKLDVGRWNVVDSKRSLCIPVALFGYMYQYQREGVAWLANLPSGGILGDEMGMGKTTQTLVFILGKLYAGSLRNALVVCPKKLVETIWEKEALHILGFFGSKHHIRVEIVSSDLPIEERKARLMLAKKCTKKEPTLVLTTYPCIQNAGLQTSLCPKTEGDDYFEIVFLDEGHRVKNNETQTSKNLEAICKRSVVSALTGTPLMNNPRELYNILKRTIGTEIVGEWPEFNFKYAKPIEAARQKDASSYDLERGSKASNQLQEMIRPYLLKRKRIDYLGHLIPKDYEFDVWLEISSEQRRHYKEYISSDSSSVQRAKMEWKCALPMIQKLRQVCNHPLLQYEDYMARVDKLGIDNVIKMSAKLQMTVELLNKWCKRQKFRTLIFSDSTMNLDIIEWVLSKLEFNTCRIDGGTEPKKCSNLVKDFNSKESMFNVMLLSIKAGGEGLTLVGACRSIIYDPPWNQATSDQAVARICRPGQERGCVTVHFVDAGTAEEKMFGKQVYKGCLDKTVLGNIDQNRPCEMLDRPYNKDELSELFTLGPAGKCESLERMKVADQDDSAWRKKCGIWEKKQNDIVIGLSRRNDIYNAGHVQKKRRVSEENVVDLTEGTTAVATTATETTAPSTAVTSAAV